MTKGSPPAGSIETRPKSSCVLSSELLRTLSEWLTECHSSHPELCKVRGIADEFVPTRLVEVSRHGDQISAKLVITHGQGGKRWCSLSYCWGSNQPYKTDKTNFVRYLDGIPCIDLSKTLRDAMIVTIALGLSYIWIDSLCIIQGDDDDLATELSHMPMIYECAWVTVAASSAENYAQGFLANRTVYDQHLCVLKYGSYDDSAVLLSHTTGTSTSTGFEKDPIASRGWTLQEHLLSPRLIEFSNHQVRWRCVKTHGYTGGRPRVFFKGVSQDHLLNVFELKKNGTTRVITQAWNTIAEEYSQRYLSEPSDRLNAISSLARRFAGLGLETYCAGLWKATLPYTLCWFLTSPGERCPQYGCPSWSWLSVSCTPRDGRPDIKLHLSEAAEGRQVGILDARIERIEQVPANSGTRYGTLKEASLIINGHLLPVCLTKNAEGLSYTLYIEGPVPGLKTRMMFVLDEWKESETLLKEGASLWYLLIDTHSSYEGLLLKKTDEKFQRLGLCFPANSALLLNRAIQDSRRQLITLI